MQRLRLWGSQAELDEGFEKGISFSQSLLVGSGNLLAQEAHYLASTRSSREHVDDAI